MKQVNLGYDLVVTYKVLIQTDIVNKEHAVQYAKDYFKDEHRIGLHEDENMCSLDIELIENIVTVEK